MTEKIRRDTLRLSVAGLAALIPTACKKQDDDGDPVKNNQDGGY